MNFDSDKHFGLVDIATGQLEREGGYRVIGYDSFKFRPLFQSFCSISIEDSRYKTI